MRRFDHIDLRVRSLAEARSFYETLLPVLGFDRDAGIEGWVQFEANAAGDGMAEFFGVTESAHHVANECRIAFWASSVNEVAKLAEVAARAGARNMEGPAYETPDYYAVFFEDPSGNRFEICHRTEIAPLAASTNLASINAEAIRGGCLCGAVRYEAASPPFDVTHCHCADCRRGSGAPFVTWASFGRSSFRFTQEQPREMEWAGRLRSFCAQCGTPLTFMTSREADEIDVTVCSFDHPEAVAPADQTWVEDQLPWIRLADGIPTYAQKRPNDA